MGRWRAEPCNIRWSAAEILYSLDDSGSSILLVDDAFSPLVEQFRRDSSSLREVIYCGEGAVPAGMHGYEALLAEAAPVPDAVRRGEDLAGIFYTGGTTGFPKGVMLSHANLCSSSTGTACRRGWPHPAALVCTPRRCSIWPPWASRTGRMVERHTHVDHPGVQSRAGPRHAIERDRVTHVLLVPTMIQMLVDHPAIERRATCPRCETIVYGASPMSEAVLERAHGGAARGRLRAGLRHDRAGAAGDRQPGVYHTSRTATLGKLRSAGRAGYSHRARASSTRRNGGAARHGRRNRRARPERDAGLLEQARGDRERPCATAGCIPATAPTWTRRASSSSSTASRT